LKNKKILLLLIILVLLSSFAFALPANQLTGLNIQDLRNWYPANNTVTDYGSTPIDFVPVGNIYYKNNGFLANESQWYGKGGETYTYYNGKTTITIGGWVNITQTGQRYGIMGFGSFTDGSSEVSAIVLNYNASIIKARLRTSTTYYETAEYRKNDGEQHIAASFDGTTLRLYLNGTNIENHTMGGTLKKDGNEWQYALNAYGGNYAKGINGTYRDSAIFNVTLTDAQIAEWASFSAPPPPPISTPTINFTTPPSPTNNSIYYLKNESLTINATITSGLFNITLKIFNDTGAAVYNNLTNNVNSIQKTINTTSLNLPIGIYYFNATFLNATYNNFSETRIFIIYNLTQNGFNNPLNNQNNTNGSLYISWNASVTNPNVSNIFNYSLTLYNSSSLIAIINMTTTNTNFFWNTIYNLNLSVGSYILNLTSTDFKGNILNQITNFNQQNNAVLNITANKALTSTTISVFNVTFMNASGSSNFKATTTGSLLMDYIKGNSYNLTIRAPLYATNSTSFASTETYSSTQFLLWGLNSLLIKFYDELTQTLMINKTVYLELISDIYSNNYSTSTGNLSVELLDPETYTARYDSLGYVERFYEFTVTEDSAQFLNLYLLNDTIADEITITVLDQDTLPLEGAVVKALKYDITTNTYITVEIATTNTDGEVVMDLTIGDEFYKFIVVYDGVIVKTTSPSYIYSNTLTIQVTIGEDILNNYDQYKDIVTSLYFEGESTNTTVFFYNDLQNLNFEFCLKMYKVRNSSGYIEQTFIGEDCSTGSSDSLTYTLTGIREGDLYLATGSYYPEGNEEILSTLYISFAEDEINTGTEGLWLQILLTILVALFCITIPEILPIGIATSLIFGNLMKLNSLNIYMLFGLLFFTFMITYGIVQLRKS